MKATDRSVVVSDGLSSGTLAQNVCLVIPLREYMYRFTGRLYVYRAQEMVADVAFCTDAAVVGGRAPTYRNNSSLE